LNKKIIFSLLIIILGISVYLTTSKFKSSREFKKANENMGIKVNLDKEKEQIGIIDGPIDNSLDIKENKNDFVPSDEYLKHQEYWNQEIQWIEEYTKKMNLTEIDIKHDPRNLKFDLQILETVLEIAYEKRDKKAIEFAYRILNDLDIQINNYKGSKFKITSFARGLETGGIQIVEVIDYIEGNSTYSIKDGVINK